MERLILPVVGMRCASCMAKVEAALSALPGIQRVAANLVTQKVMVEYEPSLLSLRAMREALEKAGYSVRTARTCFSIARERASEDILEALRRLKGVLDVSFSGGKVCVDYVEEATTIREIETSLGSEVLIGTKTNEKNDVSTSKDLLRIVLATPLALLIMLGTMQPYEPFSSLLPKILHEKIVLFALTTPLVFGPGFRFFLQAANGLRQGVADMNLLYATGIGAAYLIAVVNTFWPNAGFGGEQATFYEAAGLLTWFVLFGLYLEAKTRSRASEAIARLKRLQPSMATILLEGREKRVPVELVLAGDVLVIKPGEQVPVDGEVLEGDSAVDESMVTGESMPKQKKREDEVIAGTMNLSGSLVVRATRVGEETMLAKIVRLVENAQMSKPRVQRIADAVAGKFIVWIHIIALCTFLFWYFVGYDLWFSPDTRLMFSPYKISDATAVGFAILVSVAVLVISCPCAVALATPAAVMAGTGKAAEYGILFKGGDVVESLSKVQVVLLDKTGTLTKGYISVTEVLATDGKKEDVLRFAASAEMRSEHPIGNAILQAAQKQGVLVPGPDTFESLPGKGVKALVQGREVLAGNRLWMSENNIETQALMAKAQEVEVQGNTVVFVAVDRKLLGAIAIADTPREEAQETVRALGAMGLEVGMVTGDHHASAQAIAKRLGIEKVFAEMLPHEKVARIRLLQQEGYRVAMVGDGINDAPALATADVGIAMAAGTDIARESGHVVLVANRVTDIVLAIEIARKTMRLIKQNLVWAFGYNVAAVPIAAGVLYPFTHEVVSPEVAAALMACSSLCVTLNSIRLRWYVPKSLRAFLQTSRRHG